MPNLFALGEILLRLETEKNAPALDKLDVHIGGAAFNVAMGAANLGINATPLSVVPYNFIGKQIKRTILANGADASQLIFAEGNQGIYFFERGFGKNQSSVAYNRSHSVFADNNKLLEDLKFGSNGDILHVTGISLLLSEESFNTVIKIVEKAHSLGILISFDFNYRAKLADYETAKPRYEKLLAMSDCIFATKRDFVSILGYENETEENIFNKVFSQFPALSQIAHTNRFENTGLQSVIYTRDNKFQSEIQYFEMIERIGGGDAFVTGILEGLVSNYDLQTTANRANALAILKQSIKGDFSNIDKEQLDKFITSFDSEVSR